MENPPILSIIIPCTSSEGGLSLILRSISQEDYPALELILVRMGDPFSLPLIPQSLSYHLLTISDDNWMQAVEAGAQRASGSLITIFQPGTRLLPGCLREVEAVLSKTPESNVFVGRTTCLDAEGNELGLEHPGSFNSHINLLKIWLNDPPPLSAVLVRTSFLRNLAYPKIDLPERWNRYNILCRITQHEKVVLIKTLLTSSPLLPDDLLLMRTQEVNKGVQISRQYWETYRSSVFWLMNLSFLIFKLDFQNRARAQLHEAEIRSKQGKRTSAVLRFLAAGILAPGVVFSTTVFPFFRDHFLRKVFKLIPV